MQVNAMMIKNEGSGIGLSIVKSLIEMHNGTISVESTYGVGTTFIIKLPVKVLDFDNNVLESKLIYNTSNNCIERI
jgi:signal transduction histidine kinase